MKLAPGRLKELVEHNRDTGSALVCHKTLPYGEHPELYPVVCRGYYDRFREVVNAIVIMERLFGPFEQLPLPDDTPPE